MSLIHTQDADARNQTPVSTSNPLPTVAAGAVASGATDSGNPVKIGGVYRATPPTFADGQRGEAQISPGGHLMVAMGNAAFNGDGGGSNYTLVQDLNGAARPLGVLPLYYNGSGTDRARKPAGASRLASSANTTNATSAKAAEGNLHNIECYNTNAALRYLKIYNKASAPAVGTDTPVLTVPLKPADRTSIQFADGGLYFANGIAFALTTGATDGDTGAVGSGDIVGLNLVYS